MATGSARGKLSALALLLSMGAGCAPSWPPASHAQAVADEGPTAATRWNWGSPTWSDEFAGTSLDSGWNVYDSPGNGGNGTRRPTQVSVADGLLTQTGTAATVTAGMLFEGRDARDGRWEVRARADQDPSSRGRPYHVVVALIPVGVPYNSGERDVDFLEGDIGQGSAFFFLHHPPNKQDYAQLPLDIATWHTFAVEIARGHVTWFVDGRPVVTDQRPEAIPSVPLALNIQLDANSERGMRPGRLQIDWARYYALPSAEVPVPSAPAPVTGDYDPSS